MKHLLLFLFLLPATFLFAQWEPDVRLTNDPNTSELSYPSQHCIATSGDTIHVIWQDTRGGSGTYEIYYKRSTDAGVSWGADTRLSFGSGAQYPSIAVQGSIVHVVWYGWYTTIKYTQSTDAGVSWGSEIELYNSGGSNPVGPCIAVSGSTVHVIWNSNSDIYYKRSTDSGLNWETYIQLTNSSLAWYPSSLAVSNSDVHIVWDDNRNGHPEIYYKHSSDAGLSWGIDTRLTNNPYTMDGSPSISVYGSFVNVVWTNFNYIDYIMDISQVGSTDGGLTWGLITQITNYNSTHFGPTISSSGSVLHVVWGDDRDSIYEVYYNRSTDGGLNWEMDTRLTNGTVNSYFPNPFVSTSLSKVHVIWNDYRDSFVGEIYYKRNPNSIPVELEINPSSGNGIFDVTFSATNNTVSQMNFDLWLDLTMPNGNTRQVFNKNINVNSGQTRSKTKHFNISTRALGVYTLTLYVGVNPTEIWNSDIKTYTKTSAEINKNIIEDDLGLIELPNDFSLDANYPNPFNPTTTIKYTIPFEAVVSLVVYNTLGEVVAEIVNTNQSAGSYESEFNGIGLASGIYIYRLNAIGIEGNQNFTQIKKMLMVK